MPPIMGAAAFMIATNCDVAYGIVAVSALVPALLYYFYLFICLDAEAKKNGLKGLEASELPSIKTALKKRGHMLIPLVVLIFLLVGVAHIVDLHVVGSGSVLRGAVVCFYLSNEGVSMLENAAHLGLPVPEKLKVILEQLHDREAPGDSTDNNTNDGQ